MIVPHRAFVKLKPNRAVVFNAAGLTVLMVLLWAFILPWVAMLWTSILLFWATRLGFDAAVTSTEYNFLWVHVRLTYLDSASTIPSNDHLALIGLLLAATLLLSKKVAHRVLPLAYVLRAVVLVQAIAVGYFLLNRYGLPHNATDYSVTLLKGSLAFITLVPVILGLTYYILNFGTMRKIALTLIIMAHLTVFAPHHYLLTLYLLHTLSLAVMPVLYQFFGLMMDVTVFIGFYSWGMSWKARPVDEI